MLKTVRSSIEKMQKDNLTNIGSQKEIDFYFSFANPDSKRRHSLFLKIEIFNFIIIIFGLIVFPITTNLKFSFIGAFIGTLIVSSFLFRYKKAIYRFLSYFIDIFGLIIVLFYPIYGDFSFASNSDFIDVVIIFLEIITILVDSIFLLNYISIENARQRFMSPLVRDNKLVNYNHMGKGDWEEM